MATKVATNAIFNEPDHYVGHIHAPQSQTGVPIDTASEVTRPLIVSLVVLGDINFAPARALGVGCLSTSEILSV